jgi:pimeloyl-ACP methyl ester carboxylesterase
MAAFVLVPGAWHGGWSYRKVAKILRTAGHDVFTPTLSGVGERSHLRGMNINLDMHIQDIRNVFHWEDLQDVVLCGHSYGGMVITGVADAIPEKIAALVYLDAFVPEDGETTMDMLPPARRDTILKGVAALDGTDAPSPDVAMFNINEVDLEWVRGKVTAHPFASVVQAIRLTGAHAGVGKHVYVLAEGRPGTARFYEKFRNDPAWEVHILKGGHDLMIDAPEAVARVLLDTAS